MSDRLTRDDLRVYFGSGSMMLSDLRSVSLADWVEVGESEGGKVKQAFVLLGRTRIDVDGLGRYLVLRLPDKKNNNEGENT